MDLTVYVRKDATTEMRKISFKRADIPMRALLDAGYALDGNQVMCMAPGDPEGLRARELEVMAFIEAHGHTVSEFA